MKLRDILDKMRNADKIIVWQGGNDIFRGDVNKCRFQQDLLNMEIDSFHPELLGGLTVVLSDGQNHTAVRGRH